MDEVGPFSVEKRLSKGRLRSRDATRLVLRRAAQRYGVITRSELGGLGIDPRRVDRWVETGRLQRLYPAVYAVSTTALTQHGRWLAAVLSCGPDAVLSHLSAAALWRLLEVDPVVIDVIAPRSRKPRDGIRLHRPSPQPTAAERCVHAEVPATSAARTFLDLAALVGDATLTKALRAGERHELFTPSTLLAALGPSQGRSGFARARRILELHAPAPTRFRSDLEADAWALIAADPEIEPPEVNARVGGYEVDWLWRDRKLSVELDGDPWHRTSVDRRNDSARDATLESLGYLVLRFSDDDADLRATELVTAVKVTLTQRPFPRQRVQDVRNQGRRSETSLIKDGEAIVAKPRAASRTPSTGVPRRRYQR